MAVRRSASNWGNRRPRAVFSAAQTRAILARDHGVCYLCGQPDATEADHVIPVAEGGSNGLENGRAACTPCHREKSRSESLRGQERRLRRLRLPEEPRPFDSWEEPRHGDAEEARG